MVIEYLNQIKESYIEKQLELKKQLNSFDIELKENIEMINLLEETNDSCYELFTPRNVNSKNKKKIEELLIEQKKIEESIENTKISLEECKNKIEQLNQVIEEENNEVKIVNEHYESIKEQSESDIEKDDSDADLTDDMNINSDNLKNDNLKDILNRVELCSRLIDIDPVRCKLELSSVMKLIANILDKE